MAFWIVSAAMAVVVWIIYTQAKGTPVDAWDFWVDPGAPYATQDVHRYLYSPVFAQVISPFRLVGFEFFVAAVRAAELACALWLAGPVLFIALFLGPVATEINVANINLILAVAIALSFRWPALWSLVLLTKPTMGIGLLWFVIRRDWRAVGIALGATAAITAVSFTINPGAWFDYVGALQSTYSTPGWPFPFPIWTRLPLALPLVVWGAYTNRPWAVALGSMLAAPRLYFLSPVLLLGLLPLMPNAAFAQRLRSMAVESARSGGRALARPRALPSK
jgi:hypothetical protein